MIKHTLKNIISNSNLAKSYLDSGLGFGDKSITKLKNQFNGKRCFIIGNGPSLNKIDLSKLENEYSFGVNSIFLKTKETGFKPTFYVVEDRHVLNDNLEEIRNYKCDYKIFPSLYKGQLGKRSNTFYFRMDTGYYNKTSDFFCMPRFSKNCGNRIYCGQSVTMINIQIACYLGFKEIYLIGMDHSYIVPSDFVVEGETITSTGDDPNHFNPDYFGKGKKWHDPHLDRVERSYEMMKISTEAINVKIMNATVGGKLEVFDRINFDSLFV